MVPAVGVVCFTPVPLLCILTFPCRYGCDSVQFPRVALPFSLRGLPHIDPHPIMRNVYFLVPSGLNSDAGSYTPQLIIPRQCTVKLAKSIILSAMPAYPKRHSIEFFAGTVGQQMGWFISSRPGLPVLLDWQSDDAVGIENGHAIVVSVRAVDPASGLLVPVNPFPPPACPPRVLMWNSSCI